MTDKLVVSCAPHARKTESIGRIMGCVNLALIPSGIWAVFVFGPSALGVICVSVFAAVGTEFVLQKARGVKVTVSDGSALMTGLLLAYNLPAHCPLWVAAAGSIFAIAVAKQAFGGLGRNIFNPALAGRAFLMAAWPKYMTVFTRPFVYDAVTQATPLSLIKEGKASGIAEMGLSYGDLLIGNRSGSLGEVCVLALCLGGVYLLGRRIITWHIPVSFMATVTVFMWVFGSPEGFFKGDALFQVLSGGLVLGAVYMATDYVTSPVTRGGQLIFGVCCGLLTGVIRRWGGYPEGVCYAILIMNATVPLIDRFVKKRRYGS